MPSPFDSAVLKNDPVRRGIILSLLQAGLDAVEPERAVDEALIRVDALLQVGGDVVELDDIDSAVIIAIGKAAPAMTRATVRKLHGIGYRGLVATDRQATVPDGVVLRIAGHPTPDKGSVEAGREALELAASADDRTLVIVLISGGGSALCEMPAGSLGLESLQITNDALILSGATIHDINAVRKHVSAIKGGALAVAAANARLLTLILSDVVGNPHDVIASGPTVPDHSTFKDALSVLERYEIEVPDVVRLHLEEGAAHETDSPSMEAHPRHTVATVAGGATAAYAIAEAASKQGIESRIVSTGLSGDARDKGVEVVSSAADGLTVYVGETTVGVVGSGLGGRNQEAALAAAIEIDGTDDVVFATFATDGIDGPTPAAGAIVDGATIGRGEAVGKGASGYLTNNDSHRYLDAAGETIVTGRTGTNVGDVWLVLGAVT